MEDVFEVVIDGLVGEEWQVVAEEPASAHPEWFRGGLTAIEDASRRYLAGDREAEKTLDAAFAPPDQWEGGLVEMWLRAR